MGAMNGKAALYAHLELNLPSGNNLVSLGTGAKQAEHSITKI